MDVKRIIKLDGKVVEAEHVEIIYEGLPVTGADGSLHVNATHEGLILDIWAPGCFEAIASSSKTVDEILDELLPED